MSPGPSPADARFRAFMPAFYNRFEALIGAIGARLRQARGDFPIYAREAVQHRLLQEICFQIENPLRCQDTERTIRGEAPTQSDAGPFRLGGMTTDPRSGEVRIGVLLWLKCIGQFLALGLLALGLNLAALFSRRRIGAATLALGVPDESLFRGGDGDFAEFADVGPIAPFNAATHLLVQALSTGQRSTSSRITYVRHPVFARIRTSAPGPLQLLRFATHQLGTAVLFLLGALRNPLLALLWRDYALHASIRSLNERGLIENVIFTNSNWGRQPLWMTSLPERRFAAHMVFYSQHDRPVAYADVADRRSAHPTTGLLRADHFWVWTQSHADMLAQEGAVGEAHVVGPIIWEPLVRPAGLLRPRKWIAIFDITPITAKATRELGYLGTYYNTDNLMAFIDGIKTAAQAAALRLPLVLKPKRRPTGIHDQAYLDRLLRESGTFQLLSSQASLTEVIAASAAVIIYPHSTVANVADWMGVPAIYFDPTGNLLRTYEETAHIRYAQSVEELASALRHALAAS